MSTAQGTVLESTGLRKHISFATLLLALIAVWEVIHIIDFRLLFPENSDSV